MRLRYSVYLFAIVLSLGSLFCSREEGESGDPAFSEAKDRDIQEYNINSQKDGVRRFPCDTIALREYILNNYPSGSYLVEFDKTSTYSIGRPAVIYYNSDRKYVFAVIAKSKPGERLIEPKNVTGFESSFINLDSTKLGTAFFYLTLFACNGDYFEFVWEHEIPMHGGFNNMLLRTWRYGSIPYIDINFEDGIIVGHRDYNFFMLNGVSSYPHMLETYVGISAKRNMARVNNDLYPDYYEYVYYDVGRKIYSVDSVAFVWNDARKLYVNTRNPRQTREY